MASGGGWDDEVPAPGTDLDAKRRNAACRGLHSYKADAPPGGAREGAGERQSPRPNSGEGGGGIACDRALKFIQAGLVSAWDGVTSAAFPNRLFLTFSPRERD